MPGILVLEYTEALEFFIQKDLGAFRKLTVGHYLLSTEPRDTGPAHLAKGDSIAQYR